MKKVIIALAALIATAAAYGQGTVQFNNRIVGTVDARVFMPDKTTGVGADFTAQLYAGTSASSLTAVTPVTTFRTSSAAAAGYVTPVDVTIPGIAGGSTAFIQMKVWDGASFASPKSAFGQSGVIPVVLGGGGVPPAPAAALAGLATFNLTAVPEPSTIALGALGVAALLLRRRK